MNASSCKVAFLDRDGTINVDHGFVHRVEDWQFTEGAAEGIAMLRDAGFYIAMVTNQSGIAAGLYSESDVEMLHTHMQRELIGNGTQIDAIAICPHGRDALCACRKPRTGMAAQIEQQLGQRIDNRASWIIGDKPTDILFGLALGTKTALIRSRYWSEDQLNCEPMVIVESLFAAARFIVSGTRCRM